MELTTSTTRSPRLRAVQGHSAEVGAKINDSELYGPPLTSAEVEGDNVIHATFDYARPDKFSGIHVNAWNEIKERGIVTMGRSHIHFAVNDATQGRRGANVYIYINIQKAI